MIRWSRWVVAERPEAPGASVCTSRAISGWSVSVSPGGRNAWVRTAAHSVQPSDVRAGRNPQMSDGGGERIFSEGYLENGRRKLWRSSTKALRLPKFDHFDRSTTIQIPRAGPLNAQALVFEPAQARYGRKTAGTAFATFCGERGRSWRCYRRKRRPRRHTFPTG